MARNLKYYTYTPRVFSYTYRPRIFSCQKNPAPLGSSVFHISVWDTHSKDSGVRSK